MLNLNLWKHLCQILFLLLPLPMQSWSGKVSLKHLLFRNLLFPLSPSVPSPFLPSSSLPFPSSWIYLLVERQSNWKRGTEGVSDKVCLLIHALNKHSSQGCAKQQAGAKKSIPVSTWVARNQVLGPSQGAFWSALARGKIAKISWNSSWHSEMGCQQLKGTLKKIYF